MGKKKYERRDYWKIRRQDNGYLADFGGSCLDACRSAIDTHNKMNNRNDKFLIASVEVHTWYDDEGNFAKEQTIEDVLEIYPY